MLQNARVTAFTVSELLRENQLGGGKIIPPLPAPNPIQIRVKKVSQPRISVEYFFVDVLFIFLSFRTIILENTNFVCAESLFTDLKIF